MKDIYHRDAFIDSVAEEAIKNSYWHTTVKNASGWNVQDIGFVILSWSTFWLIIYWLFGGMLKLFFVSGSVRVRSVYFFINCARMLMSMFSSALKHLLMLSLQERDVGDFVNILLSFGHLESALDALTKAVESASECLVSEHARSILPYTQIDMFFHLVAKSEDPYLKEVSASFKYCMKTRIMFRNAGVRCNRKLLFF